MCVFCLFIPKTIIRILFVVIKVESDSQVGYGVSNSGVHNKLSTVYVVK